MVSEGSLTDFPADRVLGHTSQHIVMFFGLIYILLCSKAAFLKNGPNPSATTIYYVVAEP